MQCSWRERQKEKFDDSGVHYSLSLSLCVYIYIYICRSVHSHQDWRFCLRHVWQEEPQHSWDTDGQIGSCEGMDPGGTMRPGGTVAPWRLQRWCPSLTHHPQGPSPRASLPAAAPQFPSAPTPPSRLSSPLSPWPLLTPPTVRSEGQLHEVVGNEDLGICQGQSKGVGYKLRNAPPSGERGVAWGRVSDEERTSDGAGRGWGRRAPGGRMVPRDASRGKDGPQGC